MFVIVKIASTVDKHWSMIEPVRTGHNVDMARLLIVPFAARNSVKKFKDTDCESATTSVSTTR